MKFLSEINSFYDWLETNTMATSSIVLWFALMQTANKAGWPDTFAVAVSVIELKTGLKRDTIYDARNVLQRMGRIKFNSRKGNQSAIYEIIPFVSDIQTQFPAQYPTQFPIQIPTQCPTIKKTREEEIEEEDKACGNQKSVFSLYENNFGLIPGSIYNLLIDIADTYSFEWIEAAFQEAGKAGAKSFNYIDACLKDWRDNGFKNGRRGGKQRGSTLKLAEPIHEQGSAGSKKSSRARSSGGVAPTMP